VPLMIALIARVAMYPISGIENPRTFEYGSIAKHIANGEGYTHDHVVANEKIVAAPSAYMPPLQPLIIAGAYSLFGVSTLAHTLIFFVNSLLGTGAVLLVGLILQRAFGRMRLTYIGTLAAAVYPSFVISTATWGVACSVLFFNALTIYLALNLSHLIRSGHRWIPTAVLFGLSAGALSLLRAEAPLTIAILLTGLIIVHRKNMVTAIQATTLAGAMLMVILTPWAIRNYVTFDRVILATTNGGFNLWRGANPDATGSGYRTDGEAMLTPEWMLQAIEPRRLEQPERLELILDSYHRELSTKWITEHPIEYLALAAKKFVLLWVVDWYHPGKEVFAFAALQIVTLLFALVGIRALRSSRYPQEARDLMWLMAVCCVVMTLITMVFFSLPRYQIFLVGMYFPIVAVGAERVLLKFFPRSRLAQEAAQPAAA
jgi:hypothetical protein